MKEKRYYCDWALSSSDEKNNRLVSKLWLISLVVVTAISSLIYYNVMMHNYGEGLEAYSESAYKYLDEIADNVIGKYGINLAEIPEDVVEYEITYKDGEIVFKYSLDNNKGKGWATSASMTVKLSKDFEVLSKEPNFSSKEEYAKSHKIGFYIVIPILGVLTWCAMAAVCCIVMAVAVPISMVHKKNDMKKRLNVNSWNQKS